MVASYDEFGRMVNCAFVTVEVAEGHTVRAYLMDDDWMPLDDCRTL